jgi:hypothetical protein
MKHDMSRSSPLTGWGRRIHREEFARHRIKSKREDLVEPLVRDDHKAPAWIELDLMGLREGLLDTMGTDLSFKDDQIHKFAE